jgi:hypothetical protein
LLHVSAVKQCDVFCRYVVKEGENEEATGVPGAPSEQAERWVVGRDEAEARTAAEKKCAAISLPCSVDTRTDRCAEAARRA